MKSRFVKFFLLLWGVGAIIGAAATLSVWAVRTYRMLAWPTVTGIVRESSVATSLNGRGAAFYANVLSVENGIECYTYELTTSIHECQTISFVFAKDIVDELKFFEILDEIEIQIQNKNLVMANVINPKKN